MTLARRPAWLRRSPVGRHFGAGPAPERSGDIAQAALVIVGESTLQEAVDKAGLKAEKHVAKELDVSAKDVDKAVQEAAGEVS